MNKLVIDSFLKKVLIHQRKECVKASLRNFSIDIIYPNINNTLYRLCGASVESGYLVEVYNGSFKLTETGIDIIYALYLLEKL